MSEGRPEPCSTLEAKMALLYGEPHKKLYLVPSKLLCDENTLYLAPSSFSYVLQFVDKGYVDTFDNVKELIIKLNQGMRKKLNVVVIEAEEALMPLKARGRKVASFLAWYTMRYAHEASRTAFIVSRKSGLSGQPPFARYIEPWCDVLIEANFVRERVYLNVEHAGGVETWELRME